MLWSLQMEKVPEKCLNFTWILWFYGKLLKLFLIIISFLTGVRSLDLAFLIWPFWVASVLQRDYKPAHKGQLVRTPALCKAAILFISAAAKYIQKYSAFFFFYLKVNRRHVVKVENQNIRKPEFLHSCKASWYTHHAGCSCWCCGSLVHIAILKSSRSFISILFLNSLKL